MLVYHPALRFKLGEYTAAARIRPDMQKHIEPRFILPPLKERDPEKGGPLTPDEIGTVSGERIGKHWPLHRAFLDARHVTPYLDEVSHEKLYRIAQARNPNLVIVAGAHELSNPVFRTVLRSSAPRLAIQVPFGEVTPQEIASQLIQLGCKPSECFIFLDLMGANLEPDVAAEPIAAQFQQFADYADWGRLVYQASAYPKVNKAEPEGQLLIPRDEWKSFQAALKLVSVKPDMIAYGDYAADCWEIEFSTKASGGRAIRHLRYTGGSDTLVVRAGASGRDQALMSDVCRRIVSSSSFAGPGFSYADKRIWELARGACGPGNASNWREWNTAHHLSKVVRDLAARAGMSFPEDYVDQSDRQGSFVLHH